MQNRTVKFVKLNIWEQDYSKIKAIAQAKGITIAELIHSYTKARSKPVVRQGISVKEEQGIMPE
jgi:hypothetical protein